VQELSTRCWLIKLLNFKRCAILLLLGYNSCNNYAEAVIKINNLVEGIDEQDSIAALVAANSQELGLE
jgi:hypothetical protein